MPSDNARIFAVLMELTHIMRDVVRRLEEVERRLEIERPKPMQARDGLSESKRAKLLETLTQHGWVQAKAARALGLSPRVLNYQIDVLGIEPPAGQANWWHRRQKKRGRARR